MNRIYTAWTQFRWKAVRNDISDFFEEFYLNFRIYLVDTVEHLLLASILYIIICITLYCCIIKWKIISFDRHPRNTKRVLFVTAHPDDESMFFGPSILNYTKRKDSEVYLLCLSTGRNSGGIGSIRRDELYKASNLLGIKSSNIYVHTHTNLPDSMDVRWPTEQVSQIISNYLDSLNITTIITFDRYGVSSHSNHISIYYGVANLILDGKLPKGCGVYVLESVNLLRKYWMLLDIPVSFLLSRFRIIGDFEARKVIQNAMRQHESQLVWFRKLYIIFSRYMMINSLQQMNLVDIELDLELDD